MTVSFKRAFAEPVGDSDTFIYTCPGNAKSATIISGAATNPTATPSDLTMNVANSGDAVATNNIYISNTTLVQNGSYPLLEIMGLVLLPGDSIYGKGSVAATLNIKVGIKEIYS